jgi:hypothetical protein
MLTAAIHNVASIDQADQKKASAGQYSGKLRYISSFNADVHVLNVSGILTYQQLILRFA